MRKILGQPSEKKAVEKEEPQTQGANETSRLQNRHTYTFGTDREGKEYGIFKQDRVHTAVFGFPGTGKSTFLLSLIVQHVQDGSGFTLMDPHGDLAKKVLTFIPRDQWDRVVYIDPMTAFQYGSVVKINFLQLSGELDRSLVARSFMDSLAKIYQRFWGPRLDMILLNALYALLDQDEVRLTDLYYIIADEAVRDTYLQNVKDPKVLTFWCNEYKRMPRDASSAVLTKIYRIIQEKIITPIFDAYESSIDFRQLMDESKYVIVNLGEGRITSDLSNFLGSLILARLFFAGMSREDTPEEKRVPHYIYIDEAHRFTTTSTKDILEALRKYKVYATIASQYVDQYPKEISKAIPSLCDTMICFRVGKETAQTLEEFFQPYYTYEQLVSLPNFWFAASAKVKGVKEFAALKTIDITHSNQSSVQQQQQEEVVKHSLRIYGRPVVKEQYTSAASQTQSQHQQKLAYPKWFKPSSWNVLAVLFFENGEWTQEELATKLLRDRGLDCKTVEKAVHLLESEGFITYRDEEKHWKEKADGGEEGESVEKDRQRRERYYSISPKGIEQFRTLPQGQRGGSDLHLILIRKRVDMYHRDGFYCIIDTGQQPARKLPDILVYPYLEVDTSKGGREINPEIWDTPHRFAVEVEAEPEKHLERVYENWEKNLDLGLPTVFVVDSEKRWEDIRKMFEEKGKGRNIVENILEKHVAGNIQIDIQPITTDANVTTTAEPSSATTAPLDQTATSEATAAVVPQKLETDLSDVAGASSASQNGDDVQSSSSRSASRVQLEIERINRYKQEGFTLKVTKHGKGRYLSARKTEQGRRVEEYIGAIDGPLLEAVLKTQPDLLAQE
ncbi:MAG: DUF87 domain-containing protein [Thaumarchaeota archaeon]|nr:DUF87 domain-containing protein [Nitrososphaerota archaeon]